MTDKVQKIKDWISCQQDSLIDANGNFQHSEDEAVYYTLGNLDAYIDFLQEKSVSEDLELTWEDIRELYIIFAEVDTEIELCKTDITAETLGYYQEVLKRFNKERKENDTLYRL